MKLTADFFNKVSNELKDKFFAEVTHAQTENKNYYKFKYAVECFSNGCSSYSKLIKQLSKVCNTDALTIHMMVSKYIDDFEGFEWTE